MSRPRTNPDLHRQNVALTLPPDILMRSRAVAAQKGQSLSQLVEQLLVQWLNHSGATDAEIEDAIEQFIEGHEAKMRTQDARKKKSVRAAHTP
jgi:hypothetical protein